MSELAGVYRSGVAGATPVLLLHSSQSYSGQWRQLIVQLQPSFDVLAIDLLGYGNAPAATVDSPESFRFADELPRILSALEQAQWQQPVHLVGHSYGAALALKIALEQPFPVASLAVFEPVAFHLLDAQDTGRQQVEQIAGHMSQLDRQQATARFVDYWNSDGFFANLPARVQQVMISQTDKVILDFAALMGEPHQATDYAQVQLPVLLLQGKFSQLSAQQVAARLLQVLPQVRTQTLECGHMGPLTHAELVNPLLVEFLQQQQLAQASVDA
jgi:pimeloyl-ACP methyl ester carboxylesterase